MQNIDLAVAIPVYNEAAIVARVLDEWLDEIGRTTIEYRVFIVDDGSTDETLRILRDAEQKIGDRLSVVTKTNSGHGRTCRVAYQCALESGARWILQIDSDGQCDPAFFPEFWRRRTDADCVFGVRVQREDGAIRHLISTGCRLLVALATGRDLKDANVPYRLIRRDALARAVTKIPADFDLQNIALTLVLKRDTSLKWAYVPIRFRARETGSNSMNLRKISGLGFRMLRQIHRVGR
jgi:glycosyltransferase involved in cell wall biosynthesis